MEKGKYFWLVFIALFIFLGYKFIPVYGKYLFLKQEVERLVKRDDLKDRETLIEKILDLSKDLNMNLKADNISILETVAGEPYIEIKYERNIDLLVDQCNLKLSIKQKIKNIY